MPWGCAAAPGRPADAADIRAVLSEQVNAWNRGDLEGYMRGYLGTSALTFFSGGTVTEGHVRVLERYRRRYRTEGRQMGALTFEDLVVDVVSPDAALVRGRYRLKTSNEEATGLFTLLLRKTAEGWRIVHDHTSG
ncbi:MAG TPA: DUF4440 domain-containing protein [Planctomycetota bacterium]|nr:DUF4440 domain-containing protein [Planctomycetota bacterium]